jgi:hypothetical protein
MNLNFSTSTAPLAAQENDESPPKMLRIRYASEDRENSGTEKSLFYSDQLKGLLDGIINDEHIGEKERHEKLMRFKQCYPHIFELRFPNDSYVPPQFSMFDRFKSFIAGS